MNFEVKPILEKMLRFYEKPISKERFDDYISLLKGSSKSDLQLPISGYNPMAKEHIINKIHELLNLDAETIIKEVLAEINSDSTIKENKNIEVVINIADDLKGGWTNYYTTDFDSKFKLNALIERNFCTPYFWSSETYDKELIIKRTKEYVFRTMYRLNNRRLNQLKDYISQEKFVQEKIRVNFKLEKNMNYEFMKEFHNNHKYSEDYNLIFNFFYGDIVSSQLNYSTFGIGNYTGFDYVKSLL